MRGLPTLRVAAFPFAVLLTVAGCEQITGPGTSNVPSTPLTPAHNVAGTWGTAISVPFNYTTDACGDRRVVARAQWHVTWVVRAVSGFSNVVDVDMSVSSGTPALVGDCGLTGWVPFTSRTFRLCVDGTRINGCHGQSYDTGIATGSYTSDLMMLTWVHWECLILCFGEYTAQNELKLVRRR